MKGRSRWQQLGLIALAVAALATVFCLYGQPDLAFDLAARIWSCI
ncbi:hypothetical protein [Aquabacterium sp.]|nr:hypothetical protein [Aquabacterium sp.]